MIFITLHTILDFLPIYKRSICHIWGFTIHSKYIIVVLRFMIKYQIWNMCSLFLSAKYYTGCGCCVFYYNSFPHGVYLCVKYRKRKYALCIQYFYRRFTLHLLLYAHAIIHNYCAYNKYLRCQIKEAIITGCGCCVFLLYFLSSRSIPVCEI